MTRVLIVDDDPQQLRLLARVIATRQPGLSVVTASSGETAIEQLRANFCQNHSEQSHPLACSLK
jgi:CheY-like chemotaxis protein